MTLPQLLTDEWECIGITMNVHPSRAQLFRELGAEIQKMERRLRKQEATITERDRRIKAAEDVIDVAMENHVGCEAECFKCQALATYRKEWPK